MKSTSIIKTIYILFISLFCLFPTVNAAPGDLDTTFSQDGKDIQQFGTGGYSDYSTTSAVQPDGKILVAGKTQYGNAIICGVVRYNTDGSLDSSFGSGGKTFVEVTRYWSCLALAVQPDGKIVVVGVTGSDDSEPNSGDIAVARLNEDGSPDTTFDGDGKNIYSFSNVRDMANAVAIQPDGKIVIAGVSYNSVTGWYASDFAVVRLNPNGSLDAAFGTGGIVKTTFSGYEDIANAVAIQTDGKIVAAGKSYFDTFPDFALARYNPDGTLDTSFDGDGKVVTEDLGSQSIIHALAIQPDGKIVAAGKSDDLILHVTNLALVRYNADGSLDTTFDGDGKVLDSGYRGLDDTVGLAVQPDGKIVAASGYAIDNNSTLDFAVARYNANGSPDTTFDGDGKVVTPLSSTTNFAVSAVIQPDGKIVAVGDAGELDQFNFYSTNFALVRYNSDGTLDGTFSGDGKTTTDVGISRSGAAGVLVQADGKVLAVGGVENSPNQGMTVVRYNENGTLDSTFDGDGIATPYFKGFHIFAGAAALQTDGKIVFAGHGFGAGTGGDFAIVRLNADGSPDTTFNGDGKVLTSFSGGDDVAFSVAIQPNGKIVAAGYCRNGQLLDFALARFNTDGSLDTSFDGDGILTTSISGRDSANAVIIQTDGKIVAIGTTLNNSFVVVRYNADGSLDTTFDGDGKLTSGLLNTATAAAIQPDGKILLAGYYSGANYDFGLVRLNPNGSPDNTFGSNGLVNTSVSNAGDFVQTVAIQPDGKILAAGYGGEFALGTDFMLVRYEPNGSLDNSYGQNGINRFNILEGGSEDYLDGLALDSHGRAVVAGSSNGFFTVARVLGTAVSSVAPFDFDGDRKTDISIYRPGAGEWWINRSSTASTVAAQFGVSTDKIVPGDFTGDGKTDIAVWRPATGEWFVLRSEDNSFYSVPFGSSGDVPVPADFDGDGKTDFAVYRPSNSMWYISRSTGGYQITAFGAAGDIPVTGNYDGDGKADISIFRPSDGSWWILKSTTLTAITYRFGNSTDIPVQGDYTGDGRTDSVVWRPSSGEWFIQRSEDNSYYSVAFGATGDVPIPGDYDGDGKFDTAVFRPTDTNWYINRSTAGLLIMSFGLGSDRPVPSAFVP